MTARGFLKVRLGSRSFEAHAGETSRSKATRNKDFMTQMVDSDAWCAVRVWQARAARATPLPPSETREAFGSGYVGGPVYLIKKL